MHVNFIMNDLEKYTFNYVRGKSSHECMLFMASWADSNLVKVMRFQNRHK